MTLSRRRFLHGVSAAAAAAGVAAPARVARAQASPAQVWPSRPVRLVVGFPAGGGADAVTRIVANRLSEVWSQQVVVENRGGAGGSIASDAIAHATPDGYSILMSPNPIAVSRLLFPTIGFDPIADFAPVCLIGKYPNMVVVSNQSEMKTLQAYLAAARANPGKVTFASPGVGSAPYLAAELFKQAAKVDITHVPYRGVAAGAMSDLLAGRIDSMFNTTGSLLQSVRSGQVRGLGVTSAQRYALAPELPTFSESGVPGFDVTGWYALFAPARTPRDIIDKIRTDTVAMLTEPAVKARYEPLGIEAAGSTPEELAHMMQAEVDLWGPVIKAGNIRGE